MTRGSVCRIIDTERANLAPNPIRGAIPGPGVASRPGRSQAIEHQPTPSISPSPAPLDRFEAWPRTAPLAALINLHPRGSRPQILARPAHVRLFTAADLDQTDPFALLRDTPRDHPPRDQTVLFAAAYGLGTLLEPSAAASRPVPSRDALLIADLANAWRQDRPDGPWAKRGDPPAIEPDEPDKYKPDKFEPDAGGPAAIELGEPESATGRDGFIEAVRRAVGYIHAGDVFQVNLTHRLTLPLRGHPRDFFAALVRAASPAHGAYIELPDGRAICSVSPELFLSYDARSRRLATEPMKGTRPLRTTDDTAARELFDSAKDRAELAMIVDLMRNDLGRVARFGTVRVDDPRRVEAHGDSVLQATARVSAELRAGLGFADAMALAFPPGSVTGAPKIRAMQLIDELEPVERGFYCGAIGRIDPDGDAECSVAIRTAVVSPPNADGVRTVSYHVGCGIVADSDPEAEWRESLDKAEVLRRVVREHPPRAASKQGASA